MRLDIIAFEVFVTLRTIDSWRVDITGVQSIVMRPCRPARIRYVHIWAPVIYMHKNHIRQRHKPKSLHKTTLSSFWNQGHLPRIFPQSCISFRVGHQPPTTKRGLVTRLCVYTVMVKTKYSSTITVFSILCITVSTPKTMTAKRNINESLKMNCFPLAWQCAVRKYITSLISHV